MTMDFVQRLVGRARGDGPVLRPTASPWGGSVAEPLAATELELDGDAAMQPRPDPEDPARTPAVFRAMPIAALPVTPRAAAEHDLPVPLVTARDSAERAPRVHDEVRVIEREREVVAVVQEPAPRDVTAIAAASGPPAARSRATALTAMQGARARRQRATRDQVDPDPVVRVHIGRVDIHAAPPAPPPAQRPAAPLPSVALGKYLDERGKRR